MGFMDGLRGRTARVGVVGDAMLDEYRYGTVSRISPEFPVPVFNWSGGCEHCPGGAANVCHQLRHFNADTRLFAFLDDGAAETLSRLNVAFDTGGCVPLGVGRVPRKVRLYDGHFPLLRTDLETQGYGVAAEGLDRLREELFGRLAAQRDLDVVILSNYDKGLYDSKYALALVDMFRKKGVPTVVDSKVWPTMWEGCTVFKPNAAEARRMTGLDTWEEQCRKLRELTKAEAVVITQEGNGVAGVDADGLFCHRPRAVQKEVHSVIGAGDCFAAVLALALAHGERVRDAAWYAFEAGAQYVKERHNRPITPYELHRRLDPLHAKIMDVGEVAGLRHGVYGGLKWVWTNGVWDLLHGGHLRTLQHAKSQGDKLVVGINSDDSVRRLKGPLRPIQPLHERRCVVAGLECVDFVVTFDGDTPADLVEALRPDVIVKGAHYQREHIAGHAVAKEVVLTDILPGNSTTSIIDRIRIAHEKTGR